MRNITIKGILIDTDKIFHLHMSLSIGSNGNNINIYLHNNFNWIETLENTITILTWRKERYKSFSPWKFKELPIRIPLLLMFLTYNYCVNDYEELCKWSKTCVKTCAKSLLFKMSCILSMNSPQICAAENCTLSTLLSTELKTSYPWK